MKRLWLVALVALLAAPTAQSQSARPAWLDAYWFSPSIGSPTLPLPFVFGDVSTVCLPGDPYCAAPPLPPSAGQPDPVVVASVTIGKCPLEIRTGNIALQTWMRLVRPAIAAPSFNFIQRYVGKGFDRSALVIDR